MVSHQHPVHRIVTKDTELLTINELNVQQKEVDQASLHMIIRRPRCLHGVLHKGTVC